MKSNKDFGSLSSGSIVWIDLPRGNRVRASKMEAIESIITDIVTSTSHIPIICMIPWYTGDRQSASFPHNRWSRILSAWKPKTVTVCTCQLMSESYMSKCGHHHRFRFVFSGCSIPDMSCNVVGDAIAFRSLPFPVLRTFVRRVVGVHIRSSHCLLYTSPSPRDQRGSRMPSSA